MDTMTMNDLFDISWLIGLEDDTPVYIKIGTQKLRWTGVDVNNITSSPELLLTASTG